MDKLKLSSLEALLRLPGVPSGQLVSDASVLSCGCLTSQSWFETQANKCGNCNAVPVSILAEVKPLRDLYNIVQKLNIQLLSGHTSTSHGRRRSSLKRSGGVFEEPTESMDLISLFYKFAKEEEYIVDQSTTTSKEVLETVVQPIEIKRHSQEIRRDRPSVSHSNNSTFHGDYQGTGPVAVPQTSTSWSGHGSLPQSVSISPHQLSSDKSSFLNPEAMNKLVIEDNLMKSLSEEKEYNFSKCFPFHRKLTSFPTQQIKFNLASVTSIPFKTGSMLKKNTRFIGSSIHTSVDETLENEVTRFVLITEKRWELYEYVAPLNTYDGTAKPQLLCCGRSSGEYGESFNDLKPANYDAAATGEIIIKNEFNQNSSDGVASSQESDIKRKLQSWDFLYCQLCANYLIISGTKGIMRVINIDKKSPYGVGQAVYTYITNFPIRCISVAPNSSLVACGITARERVSGKEQPFIILHRLKLSPDYRLTSVEPITITVPYRDPIKLINFNASSTHLLCCTVWESRYMIIKLRSNENSDNYRKPRLIWTDLSIKSQRRHSEHNTVTEDMADAEDELMMGHEGITDLQFGFKYSNSVVITSCSLKSRPPLVIRLDGSLIDTRSQPPPTSGDTYSIQNSVTSKEEEDISYIKSSEVVMKLSEVGSSLHRSSVSPRGDGIVFVNKDGSIFLVSTPNLNTSNTSKKVVVLLGEVGNAERFTEAASIRFSTGGDKVFTVDRKGVFQVFDFTKGVPGQDVDVIKCKLVNV